MSMNKIILIGNIGKTPELINKGDLTFAKFSLATTSFSKGEKKTTWFNVVAFNKTAAFVGQYLDVGDQVSVVGRMEFSTYEDKNGVTKTSHSVIAENVTSLSSRKTTKQDQKDEPKNFDEPVAFDTDDDLPF